MKNLSIFQNKNSIKIHKRTLTVFPKHAILKQKARGRPSLKKDFAKKAK